MAPTSEEQPLPPATSLSVVDAITTIVPADIKASGTDLTLEHIASSLQKRARGIEDWEAVLAGESPVTDAQAIYFDQGSWPICTDRGGARPQGNS